jgi:hypothetical protein
VLARFSGKSTLNPQYGQWQWVLFMYGIWAFQLPRVLVKEGRKGRCTFMAWG